MEITKEILESILDAYSYEIVFVDRQHIVRYMNKTAKRRYGDRVQINQSLFNCHNENSKKKIEEFLKRADNGEDEMFETYNTKTGEREFFVPVRDSNKHVVVILKDMKCLGMMNIQKYLFLNIGNIEDSMKAIFF